MAAPLLFFSEDSRHLDGIRRGDEETLVTLYRKGWRPVRALVMRNSGTEEEAEEILHQSLVILWERVRSGRFEQSAKLETFLVATARNLWLRRLARKRRELPGRLEPEEHASGDPDPLEAMIEAESVREIGTALRRLGDPCRKLLLLFYWEEASMEEIARRLGFANAETAKSKKYQCKKALQELLKNLGPDHD
jgi:RNA polymerase sigma factor (sigma-70 family)